MQNKKLCNMISNQIRDKTLTSKNTASASEYAVYPWLSFVVDTFLLQSETSLALGILVAHGYNMMYFLEQWPQFPLQLNTYAECLGFTFCWGAWQNHHNLKTTQRFWAQCEFCNTVDESVASPNETGQCAVDCNTTCEITSSFTSYKNRDVLWATQPVYVWCLCETLHCV